MHATKVVLLDGCQCLLVDCRQILWLPLFWRIRDKHASLMVRFSQMMAKHDLPSPRKLMLLDLTTLSVLSVWGQQTKSIPALFPLLKNTSDQTKLPEYRIKIFYAVTLAKNNVCLYLSRRGMRKVINMLHLVGKQTPHLHEKNNCFFLQSQL